MATHPALKIGCPHRDIVIIGTSAGGVTALLALAKALPADFPAPIFVVLHVPPDSPSLMPKLLNAVSALEVRHPANGEFVRAGVIYVAPPDHHLLLEDDRILVALVKSLVQKSHLTAIALELRTRKPLGAP